MPDINITVTDKRPVCTAGTTVVCDNSDYIVHWDLDEEWSAYDSKTMRVVYMDSTYVDTVFAGDSVALPPVTMPGVVQIGLYAGDIHTSRMALLRALSSVRSASGAPANPTPDVYDQLMERMSQLENPDWNQNDPTAKDYVRNRPFYTAVEETATTGIDGYWAALQAANNGNIPKVRVSGEVYENVPKSGEYGPEISYVIGSHTITINRMYNRFSVSPDDLTADDFEFLTVKENIHRIPAEYIPSTVQGDWDEADMSSLSYIRNKPQIPKTLEVGIIDVGITQDYGKTMVCRFEGADSLSIIYGRLPVLVYSSMIAKKPKAIMLEGWSGGIRECSVSCSLMSTLTGDTITDDEYPAGAILIAVDGTAASNLRAYCLNPVQTVSLPAVTTSDNDKILKVVDGAWAVVDA